MCFINRNKVFSVVRCSNFPCQRYKTIVASAPVECRNCNLRNQKDSYTFETIRLHDEKRCIPAYSGSYETGNLKYDRIQVAECKFRSRKFSGEQDCDLQTHEDTVRMWTGGY